MFELFFKHVECLRERTDTEEPSLPRKRKAPKHIEVGEGMAITVQPSRIIIASVTLKP